MKNECTKFEKCRHSWVDISSYTNRGIIKKCRLKDDICEENECENCPNFKSKFIEFPIQVNSINTNDFSELEDSRKGSFVKVRPCAEEYGNKTYLGLYLGDVPCFTHTTYDKDKNLDINLIGNPGIYVFSLKKIIYGCESWWSCIETEEDLKDITDEDIDNVWYMKALKQMKG